MQTYGYPFRQYVATFDRRDEAWQLTQVLAAALVRARLAPEYGAGITTRLIPGKIKYFDVEIGGPEPLPPEMRDEIARRIGIPTTTEEHTI